MNNTDNPTPPVGGKERTAMATLIFECDKARKYIEGIEGEFNEGSKIIYDVIIESATELLELERKQIVEAWLDGGSSLGSKNAEHYFQSKYQKQ